MTVKLLIPGLRETVATEAAVRSAAAPPHAPATDLLAGVKTLHAFSLSPVARAAATKEEVIEVREDDILELEMEGGFTLWTSAAGYRDQLADYRPDALTADGVRVDALPQPSAQERGIRDWLSGALRILRLEDDAVSADFLRAGGEKLTAWAATRLLMKIIEGRLTPAAGLYKWADAGSEAPLPLDQAHAVAGPDALPQGKPVLVFIHGTASSTPGSFGALAEPQARPQWRALQRFFDDQIYAFEHRTLSLSPIENAIELAGKLPARARLHLVSHSRGGLVGELLCLQEVSATQIDRFSRREPSLREADEEDRKNLVKLGKLLAEKRFEIVRFVRVACPARGTLLASENIDTFLSVLTNLIGLIPAAAGNPLYHAVKRVTLEVVKNRKDPRLIPGIEAMMPSSPLVALLNTLPQPVGADLAVIAGDIEGGGLLQRLGVFVTDRFVYGSVDNDLVVNTDSMFEGLRREAAGHYVFDQGADVSHFAYFRNERTRVALQEWLTQRPGETPPRFRPIEPGGRKPVPLEPMRKRADVVQPTVFVLPGIMGSHLQVGGERVWLDYLQLLAGGLGRIRIGAGKDEVVPVSLVGDYYAGLCEYLSNTHEVMPFAYDWRDSVAEAARKLAIAVEAKLAASAQPLRIVAHSMGGLVARAMIQARPDLWDLVCARPGARLVMLGTPNRGAHSMVETLLGMAATIKQLALLDVIHDKQEILDIVAAFPGALELLPQDEARFFSTETWESFRQANDRSGAVPAAAALAQAQQVLAGLPEQLPHADKVLYVAGCAPATPYAAEIVGGRVRLSATTEGDGRVTYASGRLPGVATWYMEAEHGELADADHAFPAILELLERGTTTLLSTAPPSVTRGGAAQFRYLPPPVLYPSEAELAAGLLGKRRRRPEARARRALKVSVVHADLRFASHPVMLGHYEGDTLAGAEAYLDSRLGGALSERYQLGLYPGELGSVAVVMRDAAPRSRELGVPRGAVVLGLGKMGDLSPNVLADLIRKGALQYVMQLADRNSARGAGAAPRPGERDGLGSVGLSVLLIGCNSATNMSVEDSIGAVLRGIGRASSELDQAFRGKAAIGEIEIVELYADAAIEAAYAAGRLAAPLSAELGCTVSAQEQLTVGKGGKSRLVSGGNRDYWRRVEITQRPPAEADLRQRQRIAELVDRLVRAQPKDTPPEASAAAHELLTLGAKCGREPAGALRFLALSDRARAEVVMQERQPELIERLVAGSIRDTQFRRDSANTLFELLVPNELKDGLAQQSWLVLVVDALTANYPWELMADNAGGRLEPLCYRVGMVRQLATANYRRQIRATTSRFAYVVGDPRTSQNVPELPGARAEAAMVAELLRSRGYDPTYQPERASALTVLNGLFARPYRILHLAGHGWFQPPEGADGKARSGMLLEDGLFLTAVEIGQMRQVPDLVFINCCHLAQVGSEAPGPALPYNRLAASISRELIEMGVRAVVAAGWAVRDDAAHAFAKTFYEAMLGGETFGRALLQARRKNIEDFPDCNTWGAYQAYGDPDFKLAPELKGAARAAAPAPVAPDEVVMALNDLAAAASEAALGDDAGTARQKIRGRIDDRLQSCPGNWLTRGDVLAAAGIAYGEVGAYEKAIEHLQRALCGESGQRVPVAAIEQLANFEARWGAKTGSPEPIERAISRLRALLPLGETGERLSLLGSAHKRLARTLGDPAKVGEAIEQASRCYKAAAERDVDPGRRIDPYPVLNWLTCEALLQRPVADAETWLARCEAAAVERFAESRSFWDAVTRADALLVRSLLRGGLAQDQEAIVEAYRGARSEALATPRELDSVLDQLKFLEEMRVKLDGGETAAARRDADVLAAICGRLAPGDIPPAGGPGAQVPRPTARAPGRARRAAGTVKAGKSGGAKRKR